MCRRRVTAALCRESQVKADVLEAQAREWLESIRVRPEWAEFYAEERARGGSINAASPRDRVKTLEAKIDRLRVSWESGARTDEASYRREVADLRDQLDAARSAPEPKLRQQARTLNSLVDQWDEMTPAQKKRLVCTVFTEITMHDRALETATPHPDWARYVEEAIASANCGQRGNRTPTAKGG